MGRNEENLPPTSSHEVLVQQVERAAKPHLRPTQGAAGWLAEQLGNQPSRSSLSRMLSNHTPITLEMLDRIAAACQLSPTDAVNPQRVGKRIESGVLIIHGRAYPCRFELGPELPPQHLGRQDVLIARRHNDSWFIGTRQLPLFGECDHSACLLDVSSTPLPTHHYSVHLFSLNEEWLASAVAGLAECGYAVKGHTSHGSLIDATGKGLHALVIEGSPLVSRAAELFVKRVRMRVRSHIPVIYAALEHSTLGEFGRALPGGSNEYAVDLCPDAIQAVLSQLLTFDPTAKPLPYAHSMEVAIK
ncbi:hypothetical protein [Parachitinimonas caeni]|uniref:HTH cro/C1-type domain-containing protein n=1 Tax=Parachitinimonas caeni TaxID=3031301 RepID=A0ABT7DUD0_9NEIS|nr:hypothetical protein [Parachitinimonas caeni]MDK2122725.1 hypothetical protein [Parachitinimonas caeni]